MRSRPFPRQVHEMTNPNAEPASLRFDEARSFSDNCKALLARLEKVDAKMASILRDNWETLVVVVREGEKDSKARGEFNAKVALALDSLLQPTERKGGD